MGLRAGLFRLARIRPMGWLVRQGFAHMSFILPVDRLRETPAWMAFHHPSPSYPLHVLLVTKRGYASLMDVPPTESAVLRDLFESVQSLVREFGLEQGGYRLITNGGPNQDIPVLHFHLISERGARSKAAAAIP